MFNQTFAPFTSIVWRGK